MRRDDVRALVEQQANIHADMLGLEKTSREEKRSLSAEEQEQFDKMVVDFESVQEQRSRAEKLFAQDQMVQSALHQPIEKRTGIDNTMPETFTEYRESQREKPWGPDEPEVRTAYYRYLIEGQYNLDVEEQRALSRASGAAGNFLVPIDMATQIERAERFLGGLQDKTNVLPTESGETINYPTNLAHGSAMTTGENVAYVPSDETFGQVGLGAYKVTTKIIVSEELLQDSSFPLDSFLAQEFGERISVMKEAGLVNGSGTGTAQGIMTVAGGVPVATAALGNVTTLNYTALVTAVFTLPAQYRRNAEFVVADGSARNLYLMVDGQGRPLWNVNVANTGPDTFLGYPITTHPDLPAPAVSSKSVLFGDLRRAYTTRIVRGYSIQRQDELHSDTGQVGFRGQQRYDGRVINPDAARIIQHSAT